MQYTQRKNRNEIHVEIGSSGLVYRIKDESMKRTEKIPFENILNEQYEFYESNKTFKYYAIYAGVVGAVFLATNFFYGTRLWAWLFMLVCPTFLFLYKRSKASFTVIKTAEGMDLFVLQDGQHGEILDGIYKARDSYLREKYLGIDYDNAPQAELGKFNWLRELGVITERQYEVIREEIEEKMA